jgi:hypothetical protein
VQRFALRLNKASDGSLVINDRVCPITESFLGQGMVDEGNNDSGKKKYTSCLHGHIVSKTHPLSEQFFSGVVDAGG